MAHGTENVLRTVHLTALQSDDAPKGGPGCKKDKVNVTKYFRDWNKSCPKGQELGDKERRTLQRWLSGEQGANFKYSQTVGAKGMRRRRNRKEEGKKVVDTTDAFVFE